MYTSDGCQSLKNDFWSWKFLKYETWVINTNRINIHWQCYFYCVTILQAHVTFNIVVLRDLLVTLYTQLPCFTFTVQYFEGAAVSATTTMTALRVFKPVSPPLLSLLVALQLVSLHVVPLQPLLLIIALLILPLKIKCYVSMQDTKVCLVVILYHYHIMQSNRRMYILVESLKFCLSS